MKFRKIYLEISNLCNLDCTFCPGTVRPKRMLNEEEFRILAAKLRPWSDFLYFHLMGEPLLHPLLKNFLDISAELGFHVILTTNGTLLAQRQDILIAASALHKVNISLHSFEANTPGMPFAQYLDNCFQYAKVVNGKKLTVFRLWNQGGLDSENQVILDRMKTHFPEPWKVEPRGTRIADRTYLEYGEKFDWPDLNAPETGCRVFCYGLRDQVGVLCDGTVVPCCLDHDGNIPLGNLFADEMDDILNSPKAKAIYSGFSKGIAQEPLCRKCGFVQRFQ